MQGTTNYQSGNTAIFGRARFVPPDSIKSRAAYTRLTNPVLRALDELKGAFDTHMDSVEKADTLANNLGDHKGMRQHFAEFCSNFKAVISDLGNAANPSLTNEEVRSYLVSADNSLQQASEAYKQLSKLLHPEGKSITAVGGQILATAESAGDKIDGAIPRLGQKTLDFSASIMRLGTEKTANIAEILLPKARALELLLQAAAVTVSDMF